jgi:peroxiredoxin
MGFLSQHDPRLLFGLGTATSVDDIEVTWPGGRVERFVGPFAAGATVRLRMGSPRPQLLETRRTRLPDPITQVESFARQLRISVGRPMPDLQVRSLDGRSSTLSAIRATGRRQLVNIWATWCAPCRLEMRELQTLAPSFRAAGIDLLGVSVDAAPNVDLGAFAAKLGVDYPLFAGGVPAIEALYAGDDLSVPLSIVVDPGGLVSDILPGWSEATRRRFLDLAGK